jgi:hypothetical protein
LRPLLVPARIQCEALQEAIANWRESQRTFQRMQVISRPVSFGSLPDACRRKRLTKKVLGLI